MLNTTFLAAIFALSAATGWGAGDSSGGLAARRIGSFQTVLITNTVQLAAVVIMALARFEQFPPFRDLLWGVVACLLGIVGLGALLRGFALGRMGIVAPVSAVLATGLPVVFASFSEGLPRQIQMLGFGLALVSIWLHHPGQTNYQGENGAPSGCRHGCSYPGDRADHNLKTWIRYVDT